MARKSRYYRKIALYNLPRKCMVEECSWNEDDRLLEVHHRNHNCEDNRLSNLVVLCPICHKKITLNYYYLTDDNKLIPMRDGVLAYDEN